MFAAFRLLLVFHFILYHFSLYAAFYLIVKTLAIQMLFLCFFFVMLLKQLQLKRLQRERKKRGRGGERDRIKSVSRPYQRVSACVWGCVLFWVHLRTRGVFLHVFNSCTLILTHVQRIHSLTIMCFYNR